VLRRLQKPPAALNDNEFAVFEQVRDKRQGVEVINPWSEAR